MSSLRQTEFLTTVADLRQLPEGVSREVAFAGRSNAGKSSAINTLVGHTRLAFVSKTPGRTQLLNFFRVRDERYLVDLPGYGYAKAPDEVRDQFDKLIAPYLQHRPQLTGLVIIMDSRHPLTPLDRQLIGWFWPTGRPIHILLSKADKLTRQAQTKTLREVKAALVEFGESVSVQLFSSLKKAGIEEATAVIEGWLGIEAVPAEVVAAKKLAAAKAKSTAAEKKRKPPVKGRTGG
jgi:GTP-binding protein